MNPIFQKRDVGLSNQLILIDRAAIGHLGTIREPIGAVVIASNDPLTDAECQAIAQLLDYGCRLFMCVGQGAEVTHDRLDETLISQSPDDVAMTTVHVDEPLEDVASFLVVSLREQQSSTVLLVAAKHELTDRLLKQIEVVASSESSARHP
jgi:hypothetical protein